MLYNPNKICNKIHWQWIVPWDTVFDTRGQAFKLYISMTSNWQTIDEIPIMNMRIYIYLDSWMTEDITLGMKHSDYWMNNRWHDTRWLVDMIEVDESWYSSDWLKNLNTRLMKHDWHLVLSIMGMNNCFICLRIDLLTLSHKFSNIKK